MSLLDLPTTAIEFFEIATGLTLSYHVADLSLWTYLPSSRALHFAPPCALVKNHHLTQCVEFEQHHSREKLKDHPEGFIKVCHAGLVEWVVPVNHEGTLRMILFAGPRRVTPDARHHAHVTYAGPPTGASQLTGHVTPVAPGQPDLILELLRQLGARFEQWLRQMDLISPITSTSGMASGGDRRRWILHFIHQRHTTPITIDDLAKAMNLSPSRAAHIVKQSSGQSFGSLLTQIRVRTAAALLSHTNLSILDVALRSGFGDLSNFHRRFRQRLGVSPLQYRKRTEATRQTVQLSLPVPVRAPRVGF
jgi:AraC-like DNA-binding protein